MKDIHILSLGAGVQSTALALMAERGMIEKPVAAIFADTGDEPLKVYAHLEWIRSQVSFPIHVVKVPGKGLGGDFLDALGGEKTRASQPPFYVRAPDMSPQEIAAVLTEPEPSKAEAEAIAELLVDAELIATDLDTGEELELYGVRSEAQEILQNLWTAWNERRRKALNKDAGGMLWRACTRDYKILPIRRKYREVMAEHGATHVRQYIGISTDERQRENLSGVLYITSEHPLLDLGWSRARCIQWLWDEFRLIVPKSACYYCPYRSNAGWRYMRDHEPDEFERACVFDEAARSAKGKKIRGAVIIGEIFVHRSFTPLRFADLDDNGGQMDFGFEQECHGMCGH